MNIPVESVGSRVSTTSSDFLEERSAPTDRHNVEELRSSTLQEKTEFQ